MEKTLISIGDKFYRSTEDGLIIIRVNKIVNEDKYQVYLDNRPDKLFNISYGSLKEYTKLKPYGTLFFSIMQLQGQGNEDVAISFFRREDEGKIPYAVCRQNMEDVYMSKALLLERNQSPYFYIGVSINQDTCPEDIPFNMVLACNGVRLSHKVSIYLDDKYEDIIRLIPKKNKYDQVLNNIYTKLENTVTKGACKNMDELIKNTGFMDDICMGFDIHLLNDRIDYDEDSLEIHPDQRKLIEKELNVEMFRTYVVPYDYTININDIKRSYVLIRDITENIYIVAYDKGEYINTDMKRDFRSKLDMVRKKC
jgi:hypothetical protein